ncbi:MAG: polymer-forming cytoskeletal protein [Polyangiaceae bacterium]
MFGRAATVVGKTSTVRGSLDCGDDEAKIAGRLEGAVTSTSSVTITEDGYVEGDVSAPVVVVGGVVEGTVTAHDRLQLLPTGRILGDAIYGTLEVGRGGVVKGRTMTITSRPPDGHPAVDETLRLTAMVEDRITAEYGVAGSQEGAEGSEGVDASEAAPGDEGPADDEPADDEPIAED